MAQKVSYFEYTTSAENKMQVALFRENIISLNAKSLHILHPHILEIHMPNKALINIEFKKLTLNFTP